VRLNKRVESKIKLVKKPILKEYKKALAKKTKITIPIPKIKEKMLFSKVNKNKRLLNKKIKIVAANFLRNSMSHYLTKTKKQSNA